MAQQVAGDRLHVDSLIPIGVDPHSFEPTPQDIAKISESTILIVNGGGFEEWLNKTLQNAGGGRDTIEASRGLTPRIPGNDEVLDPDHTNGDPHFWLDPNNAIQYVLNIQAGFSQIDPGGKEIYARNAEKYIRVLHDLDQWIRSQVATISPLDRRLVTNHESFGYFADHYGFQIVGTVIPSFSTNASPSAQQLAALIDRIKATHVKAIFLETGTNEQLADQIAGETGAKVVSGLYTHSISAESGPAPSYVAMIKYDVNAIVGALK
jgi:ABC-type Zn uptake system ZnuABC Zn-binding protein ZnuA